MNKKMMIKAYMTVEASFLLPCVVIILIISIYWTFYMYNKCVVYQDCYISALRGSQIVSKNGGEIEELTRENIMDLLKNQLYQYQICPNVTVGGEKVTVSASTNIDILQTNIMNINQKKLGSERKAYAIRINPGKLIREIY